jgi:hypothetical protein
MTSETPFVGFAAPDRNGAAGPTAPVPVLTGALMPSTIICGTSRAAVPGLAGGFDNWADAYAATPVDIELLCHKYPAMCDAVAYQQPTLLAAPVVAAPTSNPAIDLRDWLTPDISIASLAAACGVSDRGFYAWLAGGRIRERNAVRLHQVRAVVQSVFRARGRQATIRWLLTPQARLDLSNPLDALAAGRQIDVLQLVTAALSRGNARTSGPTIAEDTGEAFSSYELAVEQQGPGYSPRVRRRRRVGEASVDKTAG